MNPTQGLRALATVLAVAAASACAARNEPPTPTPPAPQKAPAPTASGSANPAPSPSAEASASASPASPPPPAVPEPDPRPTLPAGFVRIAETGATTCGALRIEMHPQPDFADVRFLKVIGQDGKPLYEAHGRSYSIETTQLMMDLWGEFCGDLTGDGVPELVLSEHTMGAHCCYTRYVVSMTSPPKRILMWEKGDAGTDIKPVKYRPGKAWQIEDRAVFWPPFNVDKGDPVLSYASAPLVPVVFSLVGGDYKMTSLSFPEAYRKDRDAIRAECAGSADCDGDLIAWIDSLVIGDWATDKKNVKDAELRAALDRTSAATRALLAKQLGSQSRPGPLTPAP